ncbi:bifunctional adenosylcobinamide kinase/adenosylcobinamide-phosphate guanylyltransferase [Mariprofundus erugo]|uniref:Bifunctional adenosylcobalamin biosynthesis protein n=1 Tax=Mariprofundus erugo TaxID=2528639 RepID=A0A5R9GR74_9PROT|nr:bifunctional adenosylcobinamide kinase/adenosylcobinamide-phosphate guanylyltransferase [Mariprofundus erugo]TLS68746.1 bifunctional adenosylcobinamide kinase/adenosylcobinamide-phosphate guanylyltransferase [Mariprofundus erugo]
MPVTLILGGARSGKSRRAETIAFTHSDHPLYIATAPLIEGDDEWSARIHHHRQQRGERWRVIEEEIAIAAVLEQQAGYGSTVLVDCLTLWLANLLQAEMDPEAEAMRLCHTLKHCEGNIILVSNEVGMGLVPESSLGRAFRDAQGRLNQAVAMVAQRVEFVAAGLPICLKGEKE